MWRPRFEDVSNLRLAALAVLVGVVAGYGAVAFRGLIAFFHNLSLFGQFSFIYDANTHADPSPLGVLVVLIPVVGAFVVVFLVRNFAPEAKGHGVPEVVDAIYYNRGVIRPVVALIKALASSISIGTGGAVGREGPIIQIGSSFGSSLGQWIRMPEWQRITLIASGAAGGIAATFNAPLGGLLFSIEIILPETSARTLIPVALATGAAAFVGRAVFGNTPSFNIPELAGYGLELTSLSQVAVYVLLGLLLGLAALFYIRSIYAVENLAERYVRNDYLRHAAGMFLVGLMMYLFMHHAGHYYIQGVGYATVQDILTRALTDPWFLMLLFAAKMAATALTLGTGASGGVFSPALFLGASLGAAFGGIIQAFAPGIGVDPATLALVGMAAVVGSATGAVLTAIIMIFEMTRDYHAIIPLMITVSLAYGVRRLFMEDSIYTYKLARRGHYVPDALQTNLFMLRRAMDVIETPLIRVSSGEALGEIRRKYLGRRRNVPHVLVIDGDSITAVLTSERHWALTRSGDVQSWLEEHVGSRYIVVGREDMVFDIVGRMRAENVEIALVTPTGKLEHPEDVVGVLTLSDIVRSSRLARQMLRYH
ncbi:MAG: chloride channel protein [Gammaproteobacteria bacterium]|jgi:CIC family chloride channel protein